MDFCRHTAASPRFLRAGGKTARQARCFLSKEECPLSAFRWVLTTMSKNRYRVIIGMILNLACVGLNVIGPMIYTAIIDDVIVGGQAQRLASLCIAAIAIALCFSAFSYLSQYSLESASQNTERDLRNQLYAKLQKLDQNFYSQNRTGDLMMKLTGDLDWVRHFTNFLIPQAISNGILFVVTLTVFFSYNWKLALLSIVFTPLTIFITTRVRRNMRPAHDRVREQMSKLNTLVQEDISGNRVVKAFVREKYELDRFQQQNLAYRDAAINTTITWQRFAPFLDSLSQSMSAVILLFGGIFCINGSLTLGQLSLFMSLSWGLNGPMTLIGTVINDYQRFLASADKIMTIYFAKTEIESGEKAYKPESPRGDVEFKNVSFRYPDAKREVLTDINIKATAGQTIGIMGPTGCGKSTIISLMPRFMDASSGQVLVDGVDVRDYDLTALRKMIGVSMQDVFLFSETIDANIAYGNPEMDEQIVIDCAVDADADSFIRRMPEAYDTIIGERGVGLSGGQKQRIALARALAYESPILVLDDTTSAVDMDTEAYIQERLRKRKNRATTFIVAQRISSVKDADCIYIIENGRVSEFGTHAELLKKRGYYYKIYCLQNGLEEEGGEA